MEQINGNPQEPKRKKKLEPDEELRPMLGGLWGFTEVCGKCLIAYSQGKELLFFMFINFCGVITPTVADFKLPVWQWKQGLEQYNHLSELVQASPCTLLVLDQIKIQHKGMSPGSSHEHADTTCGFDPPRERELSMRSHIKMTVSDKYLSLEKKTCTWASTLRPREELSCQRLCKRTKHTCQQPYPGPPTGQRRQLRAKRIIIAMNQNTSNMLKSMELLYNLKNNSSLNSFDGYRKLIHSSENWLKKQIFTLPFPFKLYLRVHGHLIRKGSLCGINLTNNYRSYGSMTIFLPLWQCHKNHCWKAMGTS